MPPAGGNGKSVDRNDLPTQQHLIEYRCEIAVDGTVVSRQILDSSGRDPETRFEHAERSEREIRDGEESLRRADRERQAGEREPVARRREIADMEIGRRGKQRIAVVLPERETLDEIVHFPVAEVADRNGGENIRNMPVRRDDERKNGLAGISEVESVGDRLLQNQLE